MANDIGSMITADLAALTNEAQRLQVAAGADLAASGQQGSGSPVSFSQTMKDAIKSVDAEDQMAAEKMAAVDSGKSDDLVGAMLASQQASLSFSMLMQVRNKVMGAVEDLLKLPV
jgi:flagellar hook-basal body complex protein FliE